MHALITGASSGIGKELAALLASKGYKLILCGRDQEALYQSRSDGIIIAGDLTTPPARQAVIAAIHQYKPQLIINNAGIGHYGKFEDVQKDRHLNMIELNISALVDITYEAISMFEETGIDGKIVNISSVAGFIVFPYHAVYSATKAFVTQFSQSVDAEVSEKGIRVLVSCPGVVKTKFRERAAEGKSKVEGNEAMTVSYAAKRIWNQIESEIAVDIFDWRYHLMVFACRYFIPTFVSNAFLKRKMKKYL